ncbi:uncharacterized protein PHALS_07958 [Plasmopara halstedii]|uniref:Uncharacterized protein n=1 Tax=Plasmopara halstedii TaxID=4781 RepID=A0A0P1B8H8_PLAHL|nr:uncharacterized protein PHALS_07958 [Plasmopara halstedii]CEG50234.1 hypothetical protein PHALS_07958 [Plasmopara halstedii]|eukprot:XP_024586603.1 hypothetical protein PHALS_07958 [Plasmopara halstedii]
MPIPFTFYLKGRLALCQWLSFITKSVFEVRCEQVWLFLVRLCFRVTLSELQYEQRRHQQLIRRNI